MSAAWLRRRSLRMALARWASAVRALMVRRPAMARAAVALGDQLQDLALAAGQRVVGSGTFRAARAIHTSSTSWLSGEPR